MYSPKIDEDLIPCLYRLAKFMHMPMTRLVSMILAQVVEDLKRKGYGEVFQAVAREEKKEEMPVVDSGRPFAVTLPAFSWTGDLPGPSQGKTQYAAETKPELQVNETKTL